MTTEISKQDRDIFGEYTTVLGATVAMVANRMGISRYGIRAALERCRRAGMGVKRAIQPTAATTPPLRADIMVARVPQMSSARINSEATMQQVSLPRVMAFGLEQPQPPRRLVTSLPEMTPLEEMKIRRLALIKAVHQSGLRRGLFQSRSR